jgi:hypothetical protein
MPNNNIAFLEINPAAAHAAIRNNQSIAYYTIEIQAPSDLIDILPSLSYKTLDREK